MWKKKLKYKKKQFALIGLMLFMISLVLSTCLNFYVELMEYADFRFSNEFCPDAYVYSLGDTSYDSNFLDEAVKDNIQSISRLEGKNILVPLKHGNTTISSVTSMLCCIEDEFRKYIHPIKGECTIKDEPDDGEVWIVSTLANSYGVDVGDDIDVMYEEPVTLKVTGIYASTYAPSERLTIMASIVNQNTLNRFENEEDGAVIAVNLKNTSQESINQLAMNNPNALMTMDREMMKTYVTKIQGVVGIISAFASFVVFLASLYIIRFILKIDVQKELVSIGTYKTLGFTNKSIRDIYSRGYLFTGTISIIAGAIISAILTYILCNSATSVLGMFSLSYRTLIALIIICVVLVLILWIGLNITLRALNKITPVEILTLGKSGETEKIGRSVIKSASTPFKVTVNNLFKHKKSTLLSFVILTLSFYLMLFFGSSYYTCSNMYPNANKWVATPKFDVIVTGNVTENISKYARQNGDVKSAICGNCFNYPPINLSAYEGNSRNIDFYVFEYTSSDITGVQIGKGSFPSNKNEIAVSDLILKQTGIKIGDQVNLEKDGKTIKYIVCGSFASMESLTIYMTVDGMKLLNPNYKVGMCMIRLNDLNKFDELKNDLESNFSGITVSKDFSALKSAINAIEKMLTSIMIVLLIIFALFAIVSIINLQVLSISNKKKQYGIMKSMGFDNKYIMRQNMYEIFIEMIIGLILGLIMHKLFSAKLFKILIIDAMSDSKLFNFAFIGFVVLVVCAVVYFVTKNICKVTPLYLMED